MHISLYLSRSLLQKFLFKGLLVFLFLGLIVFVQTDIPDFNNYKMVYDVIGAGRNYLSTGIGWLYLCKFGNLLHLNYRVFKTIFSLMAFMTINSTLQHFVTDYRKKRYFWLLYLIFPFLLDCIQFRFLVASALFICSTRFFAEENIKNFLKGMLFVLLAASIHSSFIFYLLLIPFLQNKKIQRFVPFILTLCVIFLFLTFFQKELIIQFFSHFISGGKITRYFYSSGAAGFLGFIAYCGILILNFFMIRNLTIKILNNCNENTKEYRFVKFMEYLNLATLFLIPFLRFDVNFIRLARPIWILNYIMLLVSYVYDVKYTSFLKIKLNYNVVIVLLAIFENLVFFSAVSFDAFQQLLF